MKRESGMLLKTLLREVDNDSKMQTAFSKNVSGHRSLEEFYLPKEMLVFKCISY